MINKKIKKIRKKLDKLDDKMMLTCSQEPSEPDLGSRSANVALSREGVGFLRSWIQDVEPELSLWKSDIGFYHPKRHKSTTEDHECCRARSEPSFQEGIEITESSKCW